MNNQTQAHASTPIAFSPNGSMLVSNVVGNNSAPAGKNSVLRTPIEKNVWHERSSSGDSLTSFNNIDNEIERLKVQN